MKAFVIDRPGHGAVQDIPYSNPRPGEVVVKVESAGLCGSDYHIFNGTYPAQYPLVPGHEFAGVLAEVGSGASRYSVGQRVAVDPNIYCYRCAYCLNNQQNMCENQQAIGVTRNGGFAEYVAVPEDNVYVIPDSVSFDEGALIEPISCIVYALRRLRMEFGSRVIILGAGPMGLMMLKSVIRAGASEIVICDLDEYRLASARSNGAMETYSDIGAIKGMHPMGFDIVIEATGKESIIEKAFSLAAKRAKILQFGCADRDARVNISPFDFFNNDWHYIGTRAYTYSFIPAISLMATKSLDLSSIVNDFIGLDRLEEYMTSGRPPNTLKTMVKPGAAAKYR